MPSLLTSFFLLLVYELYLLLFAAQSFSWRKESVADSAASPSEIDRAMASGRSDRVGDWRGLQSAAIHSVPAQDYPGFELTFVSKSMEPCFPDHLQSNQVGRKSPACVQRKSATRPSSQAATTTHVPRTTVSRISERP